MWFLSSPAFIRSQSCFIYRRFIKVCLPFPLEQYSLGRKPVFLFLFLVKPLSAEAHYLFQRQRSSFLHGSGVCHLLKLGGISWDFLDVAHPVQRCFAIHVRNLLAVVACNRTKLLWKCIHPRYCRLVMVISLCYWFTEKKYRDGMASTSRVEIIRRRCN